MITSAGNCPGKKKEMSRDVKHGSACLPANRCASLAGVAARRVLRARAASDAPAGELRPVPGYSVLYRSTQIRGRSGELRDDEGEMPVLRAEAGGQT